MALSVSYVQPTGVDGIRSAAVVGGKVIGHGLGRTFAVLDPVAGSSQTFAWSDSSVGAHSGIGSCSYDGALWSTTGSYSTASKESVAAFWPDGTYDIWTGSSVISQPKFCQLGSRLIFGESQAWYGTGAVTLRVFDLVALSWGTIPGWNATISGIAPGPGGTVYVWQAGVGITRVDVVTGTQTPIAAGGFIPVENQIAEHAGQLVWADGTTLHTLDQVSGALQSFPLSSPAGRMMAIGTDNRAYTVTTNNQLISFNLDGTNLVVDPILVTASNVHFGVSTASRIVFGGG